MTVSRILIASMAMATSAQAAETDVLFALRDAVAPGFCSAEEPPVSYGLTGGTLHEVPCATTAHDTLSVFIWEAEGHLRPLFFPSARVTGPKGDTPNWSAQEVQSFSAEALASSPVIEGDSITLLHRVPPGLGDGYLVHDYMLQDGQPLVTRVSYAFAIGYDVALWPASARPDRLPPVPFDLDGFAEVEVPTGTHAVPWDVLQDLTMFFPAHPEEEGRPRMTVQMTQYGAQLALEVEEKGWADDSVAGQAYRVLIERVEAGWQVARIGKVNLCSRGEARKSAGKCP